MQIRLLSILFVLSALLLPLSSIQAADDAQVMGDAAHKLVIQVNSKDPKTQKIALNNVANLQAHYGMDNITIEVVAYGPGLSLLTNKSREGKRVSSLIQQNVTFSACNNTMKAIERKTGHKPILLTNVGVVPAGVARIMELQEQGYSYIKP